VSHDLERLRVDRVERLLGLVAEIVAAPVGGETSIPLISPAIVLVAGSMRWMLSPAALVWTIRTLSASAPRMAGKDARARSREEKRMPNPPDRRL
jgi:hypothetical protein